MGFSGKSIAQIIVIYLCFLITACEFNKPENKFLSDKHISQNAKDYYLDKYVASDDERTLSIVDSLNTKNDSTRYFYFLLVSKMQITADGALSEAIGNSCKDFLERYPNDLIRFLYSDNNLKDTVRISSWAKSIAGEFSIDCENSEMNCADLSRISVESNHHISDKTHFDHFYREISKYVDKPNGEDTFSVRQDKKKEIEEQFLQWRAKQYKTRRFVTIENCNPDSALKKEDSGLNMGIPDDVKIKYSDINQDGELDGLFLFNPVQCDGGNALMNAQTRVLVLSDGTGYTIDDTLIDKAEKNLKKGWLIMERTAGGTLYGTYYEYAVDDGRCCPSIQKAISIDFRYGKLVFIKDKE